MSPNQGRGLTADLHTTFLIPNLHCPTCVTHISSLMEELEPKAEVKSISTVSHNVTIAHHPTISAASISDLLSTVGYEVFDTILDNASSETTRYSSLIDKAQFEAAVTRWQPDRPQHVDETTRLLHDHHCQMCAAHLSHSKGSTADVDVITMDSTEDDTQQYIAVFSIGGMTCSSCVGNVTKALQGVAKVDRADVSLVAHSANVVFRTTPGDTDTVVKAVSEAVDDSGYDIELVELKAVATKPDAKLENQGDIAPTRTASLQIKGMHCPHCPERILAAVQEMNVEMAKPVTLESPVLTIKYHPNAPDLTIRTIIDKIAELDRSFIVTIHKPVSIEERSRAMMSRERKAIFVRALLCVIISIPTLVIGIVYMNLVSKDDPGYRYLMRPLHHIPCAEWILFTMATVVYFFAADHFHQRMIKELYALWRPRSQVKLLKRFYRFGSMNMLVSLGTTIAYFSSLVELILVASSTHRYMPGASKQSYFDSVVFLTMFLLFGRLAEAHMKAKSGDAVSALGKLRPVDALLVQDNDEEGGKDVVKVNVELLDLDDVVKIPHGSSPPCDGVLLDENASVDESSLTGESRVVHKSTGDPIYSGTINKGSVVHMRVTAPAGTSMLDSIIQIVREGQSKRAPMERIADLLTAYFVPFVVAIAIITWFIWLSLGESGALPDSFLDNNIGGWPFWSLRFAIAVFVIACPCGLGLAAPTALFVGGGMAANRGILVKGGGEAFQEASNLDAIVFDKTGTLTEGVEPKIVRHLVFADDTDLDAGTIMGVIKAVEENSSHPLAKAVVNFVAKQSAASVQVLSTDEIAGRGLKATLRYREDSGQAVREALVGNEALMAEYAVAIPDEAKAQLEEWKSSGHSVILEAIQSSNRWTVVGIFAAADAIRPEAVEVIASLQKNGLEVWMLSGDNPSTARAVGAQVGIPPSKIIAGVLPAQKADKVRYLQQAIKPRRHRGFHGLLTSKRTRATVAMVGDGINDAPALAVADVGIAVASGSDVAVQSAAFVLVKSDLRAVLALVELSRAVFRRVILNFFWAAVYNLVALPVAAGVLYPVKTASGSHVRLDPAWAALAMALSSLSVVASSLLLRTRLPVLGFRR